MNSEERVLSACAFQPIDRVPKVEFFWDYPAEWQNRLGPVENVNDVVILAPNEGAFPSWVRFLKSEAGYRYEVDQWGRTIRRREGAYFVETLDVPLGDSSLVDKLPFDHPGLNSRYLQVGIETIENTFLLGGTPSETEVLQAIQAVRKQSCVFGKVGGPYLRSTYLRGETQFLTDIAQDPGLAQALAEKVAEHLLAIGLEQIRRWSLQGTGIWVFDDIAHNGGPMFSPVAFRRIFLPAYRKMVDVFKHAGAKYVIFHSDGDIRLFLEMLIDAGFDGINPVEPRANMRVTELRRRYPRLILTGGMDNTGTLIHGPPKKIRAETLEILEVGQDGGLIIGSGYTGPEIPLKHFWVYHETCLSCMDRSNTAVKIENDPKNRW